MTHIRVKHIHLIVRRLVAATDQQVVMWRATSKMPCAQSVLVLLRRRRPVPAGGKVETTGAHCLMADGLVVLLSVFVCRLCVGFTKRNYGTRGLEYKQTGVLLYRTPYMHVELATSFLGATAALTTPPLP